MSEGIDYADLLRRSTLGLVREVLTRVERDGIPGEHNFYLTFRTGAPGVEVPPALQRQYPETMTIVLQHQFWELAVEDDSFSVTLRFGGEYSRLRVPFEALVSFLDPSVPFGLDFTQFDAAALADASSGDSGAAPGPAAGGAGDEPAADDGGDLLPFRPRES